MSQSAIIRQSEGFLDNMPIGAILAWHRDLDPATHLPTLPPGWVMCNGQVLDDVESPFNGLTVPNLNGDSRFLRGSATSGTLQDDQLQTHQHDEQAHTHGITQSPHSHAAPTWTGAGGPYEVGHINSNYDYIGGPPTSEANANITIDPGHVAIGDPSAPAHHGAETRPVNMSVIWIMKIKHVVSARAVPAVQAAPGTPPGAIYVGESGNVGIGTSSPNATLQVNGTFHSPGSIVQVVTVPITQMYGSGVDNAWSADLLTLTIVPRFANSKVIVSCHGTVNLGDDGGGDPHLGAFVRIMAGGVRIAASNFGVGNTTVPSVQVGFSLEGQHLPGSTAPINYGLQLWQRADTTAYLFDNGPESGGPYLFKAMEIAQ